MATTDYDSIGIKFINDKQTQKFFNDLNKQVQSKIIYDALKKQGKLIIDRSKSNFQATKKNKSTTNYAEFNRAFKIQNRMKRDDELGIKVGMQHREGYKYRFINYGTEERFTKKDRSTGQLKGTKFFTDAVDQSMPEIQENINQEIKNSLEKIVAKYANN